MHVALYLKHFPAEGPLNGGTARAVGGLAQGLAENGVRVTVLCEGPERVSRRDGHGYAVECFVNRAPYRSFALAPGLKRYVAEALARERSLCTVNGMFAPSAYAMARLLRRHGVPYVAAPHDPYDRAVFARNPHLKWPYWFLLERRLLARAAAVQVFDARHGRALRRLGIGTPLIETANGFAPEELPAEAELRWSAPGQAPRFGFLGRIDAYNKGLDLLIDAFARVAADARLGLCGPDWGDRARLEARAARLGLDGRIEFAGPDYARSPTEIVAGCDVFCLPSRFEGFGLSALEAMLAARALLVSERAGIAPHVRASGCGVIVPPTAEGIEAGMAELLVRRSEWRAMGLAGRRHARERLRWKDIAGAALREYGRLLG